MYAVGLRELKAKLSSYVQRAREGELILVTERGKVVSELRPPTKLREIPDELLGIQPLIDRGELTLGRDHDVSFYKKSQITVKAGTGRELIDMLRADATDIR